MHAYLALNQHDAEWLQAQQQIPCKAFAFKGQSPGKYVPLMESIQGAMDRAISTNTLSATPIVAAKEATMWFILEMATSDDETLDLFQEGVLSRAQGGWRWHKDLHLSEVNVVKWIPFQMEPIGMEQWAALKLKTTRHEIENGKCAWCGATNTKVWETSTDDVRVDFCTECCHRFLMEQAIDGIFEPIEKLNDTKPMVKPVGQKPSPPQKMKAYIAFNEYDARYCDSTQVLPCKCLRPNGKYVPLRDTWEKAVQSAMDRPLTATHLEMANQCTTWYILEMTFSAYKQLQFFQSGALYRMEEGWRFYGDLQRSEAESWQWAQCTMPASGMMTWACQALKSKPYSCSGSCIGCGAMSVPVWTYHNIKKSPEILLQLLAQLFLGG